MGIFDWKHWIVLLVVVVLVFGTKKLKNLGGDLGESIKGFRNAMNDEADTPTAAAAQPAQPAPMPHPQSSAQPQPGHIAEGRAQPAQAPLQNA